MNRSAVRSVALAALALCGVQLLASDRAAAEPLEIVSQQDASFISGGNGRAERELMLEDIEDFDLLVTFASKYGGGELSAVDVRVEGPAKGAPIELASSGPVLLGQLPPGNYTLTAELAGWQPVQRDVKIGQAGLQKVHIAMEPAVE